MFSKEIKNSAERSEIINVEDDHIASLIESGLALQVDDLIREALGFNTTYRRTVDLIYRIPLNIINKITNMIVTYAAPATRSASFLHDAYLEVFFPVGMEDFLRAKEEKYPGYSEKYHKLAENFSRTLERIHKLALYPERLDDSEIIFREIKSAITSGRIGATIYKPGDGEEYRVARVTDEVSIINLTKAIFEDHARDELLRLLNSRQSEISQKFEIEKVETGCAKKLREAARREEELVKRIRDMEQKMMEMEIEFSKRTEDKLPEESVVLRRAVTMSAPSSSVAHPSASEPAAAKSTTHNP